MPDKRRKPEVVEGEHAPKMCVRCGRAIAWRKKWDRDWDTVRFCSDGCRAQRTSVKDVALEATILKLLSERGAGKTICPSEAARAVAGDDAREAWEPLMEPAREAARRLVAAGRIVITQRGVVVDPSTAKGPIRLRMR